MTEEVTTITGDAHLVVTHSLFWAPVYEGPLSGFLDTLRPDARVTGSTSLSYSLSTEEEAWDEQGLTLLSIHEHGAAFRYRESRYEPIGTLIRWCEHGSGTGTDVQGVFTCDDCGATFGTPYEEKSES